MAASIESKKPLVGGSLMEVHEVKMNTLVSDQVEDIPHGGPSSVYAAIVLPIVTTEATSGDPVSAIWVRDSDSVANNTVRVKFSVGAGGDITGAKASVFIMFFNRATAGLNPP